MTQKISGMPWWAVMMWRLLPSLPLSVGLGPVVRAGACVLPPGAGHAGSAEVQLACTAQLVEQQQMQAIPHACGLPVTQTPPAGHATAKAQFLGQFLPWDAGAQHEQDAIEGRPVAHSRATVLGRG